MKMLLFLFFVLLFSQNIFSQDAREVDAMLAFKHRESNILLRFKENTPVETKEMIFQKLGAVSSKEYQVVADLYLVTLPARADLKESLLWLRENEEVLYSEPNYIRKLHKEPNDTLYQELWGMKKIKAPSSWDISTQSDMIVGVIDSGIVYDHEDLAGNIWVNTDELNGIAGQDDDGNGYVDDIYGYDFANGDSNPTDDDSYHGTHIAGIIGALGNNNKGVAGVCWSVKIMALKTHVNNEGTVAHIIDAIQYAVKKGARVLNMSYGQNSFSQSEKDAIKEVNKKSVACIASAGNESSDNDITPVYPASYSLVNLIAVAASDETDKLAYFSNFGAKSVHLLAPGEGIFSTIGGGYEAKNGTSMAAPHVTGSVALLYHRFPRLTPEQILGKILRNVTKLENGRQNTISNGQINLLNAMNDDEEVTDDYKSGGGGSGCSSSHNSNSINVYNIIPYAILLFLFLWKKR
ncbi:MAG: S8 family serine peptidase [Candidatus Brocadiae bacterium]|nr:S8 family serine peptidase [Candidatus Brocadiia bacterium]